MSNPLIRYIAKHPLVGPLLWILAVQYFIVQMIVASYWPRTYDLKFNVISDLGAYSQCGIFDGRFVCSPLAWLMDVSFVLFGATILVGAILIYFSLKPAMLSRIGFSLMVLSGVGTIMVGLFPENVAPHLHQIGAVLGLLVGNVALLLIGLSGIRQSVMIRIYTVITGLICVVSFTLFALRQYLGIGIGGMERLVSYPFAVWMIVFGIYLFRQSQTRKPNSVRVRS